jgi:hypothetical protein
MPTRRSVLRGAISNGSVRGLLWREENRMDDGVKIAPRADDLEPEAQS